MSAPLLDGYVVHVVARYGLSANVPTLRVGEFGYDTDTKTMRIGDDTSSPPKIMTTKSTGTFDFSSVTTITLPGGTQATSDGKVDGVDISSLNQNNGLLVRTGNGTFGNTQMISGDSTLLITNSTGVLAGGIDIRLNPNVSFIPDGDKGDIVVTNLGTQWNIDTGVVTNTHLAVMSIAGIKGALNAGAVSDLTPVQVADMLPLFGTITKGVVPPYVSVQGRVLSDTGWVSPGELFGRLDGKESVRCTATVNVNMAGTVVPIDGVTLANNATTRVGLAGQTTASQNGIYDVSVTGSSWTWTRSADANSNEEVTAGMSFWSSEGTENSDCVWYLTTNDPIVLGTTALVFVKADYGANFVRKTGDTMSGTLYSNTPAGSSSTGNYSGVLHATNVTDTYSVQGLVQATTTNSSGAIRGRAAPVFSPGVNYVTGILAFAGTYSFYGEGVAINHGALQLRNHVQFGAGLIEFPDMTQQTTAFVAGTYVRKSGDTMSGSLAVTGSASSHAVWGQPVSAGAYGGVFGVSQNNLVYGILGYNNANSFYGNGLLANHNGHIQVGTLGYGIKFADNTIQYTAARGAYMKEVWKQHPTFGNNNMVLKPATLMQPNPSFGLSQRISGIVFTGGYIGFSGLGVYEYTATFAAAMPDTNYSVKVTMFWTVPQNGDIPAYSGSTVGGALASKTVNGFVGGLPSGPPTSVIDGVEIELEHYVA
jgi:hypothetical protein